MTSRVLRVVGAAGVLFVVYTLTADLGLRIGAVSGFASLVWAPTGIALAALLRFGYRLWPGIALGAWTVNWVHGAGFFAAAGIAAGNTLEALAGAWLLCEVAGFRPDLARLRDVIALATLGASAATALSATIGVISLGSFGIVPWSEFAWTWTAWWQGDMLGALTVAPALLVWWSRPEVRSSAGRLEAVVGGACASFVILAVFGLVDTAWATRFPKLYLVIPFVVWAALRFGQRGATVLAGLTAAIAIGATATGSGPFVGDDLAASLIHLQTFLVVVALTGLTVAAVEMERRKVATERIQAQQGLERQVAERTRELRQARDELEVRVRERTEDLRRSNADLAEENATRKALELALQQKIAELAEEDRRKDNFLAILGHELRNPLASISSALEVLRLRAADPTLTARMRAILERQVRHLTRLVDDLLDVSRITRGKFSLRVAPIDLGEVVSSAVEIVRPLIDERGQQLRVELPAGRVSFQGDAVRLSQMIANLLNNASKFSADGGPIVLTAEHSRGSEVVISVADAGLGIEPDALPRIFEPFVQTSPSLAGGGLGIGLSLVRSIAELHGGTVEVASAGSLRGSRFTVRLPGAPSASAEAGEPSRARPPHPGSGPV